MPDVVVRNLAPHAYRALMACLAQIKKDEAQEIPGYPGWFRDEAGREFRQVTLAELAEEFKPAMARLQASRRVAPDGTLVPLAFVSLPLGSFKSLFARVDDDTAGDGVTLSAAKPSANPAPKADLAVRKDCGTCAHCPEDWKPIRPGAGKDELGKCRSTEWAQYGSGIQIVRDGATGAYYDAGSMPIKGHAIGCDVSHECPLWEAVTSPAAQEAEAVPAASKAKAARPKPASRPVAKPAVEPAAKFGVKPKPKDKPVPEKKA